MTRLRGVASHTFRSIRTRNFRYYFVGQIVSAVGSWIQVVAQAWLVLDLAHDGIALGITMACQFTPVLLGGAWAGAVVDRLDKRKLMVRTATASGVLATMLGVLAVTGVVHVWMVWVIAFLSGCVNAIDTPARRSFVTELVPPGEASNAISLNSAVFTGARAVGPAIAGLLIASIGVAWCFLANGASFIAVIAALLLMRPSELYAPIPVRREKRQVREGLEYVWHTPAVRLALGMVLVLGIFAFNYQVQIPLLARRGFHAGPEAFGLLFIALSIGSLAGALVAAHRSRSDIRLMVSSALLLGIAFAAAGLAPSLTIELLVLVPLGYFGMVFLAMATAVCQEDTRPELRGRVMALFSVAFMGTTPIGGPIVGAVADAVGARASMGVGALGSVAAAVVAAVALRRRAAAAPAADQAPEGPPVAAAPTPSAAA